MRKREKIARLLVITHYITTACVVLLVVNCNGEWLGEVIAMQVQSI